MDGRSICRVQNETWCVCVCVYWQPLILCLVHPTTDVMTQNCNGCPIIISSRRVLNPRADFCCLRANRQNNPRVLLVVFLSCSEARFYAALCKAHFPFPTELVDTPCTGGR